jgi:AraC family transcriptional regulator of adaptative response / DNA-3-methyladenine glycosylase II
VRRFNALFASRYRMVPGALRRAGADDAAGGALTIRLAYRPPYAWTQMMHYLAARAIPGVEAVQQDDGEHHYVRSVRLAGVEGWLRVSHLAGRSQLRLEVAGSLAPLMPLAARVRSQFDLDANPAAIEAHLAQDELLLAAIRQSPGLRVPGAFEPFELAVRAVLGQQVSVAGATTLAGRLVARFGQPANTPYAGAMLHFPTPEDLAVLPPETLAQIGLPRARAATLVALASFAARGGLRFAPGASLEETVTRLKTVPGIGDWTAQYIALRALRFPDAFPAGDLGLQKAASGVPGGRLDARSLQARAAAWAPWRAYAALLLWHQPTHTLEEMK